MALELKFDVVHPLWGVNVLITLVNDGDGLNVQS
jgi:hypothetical protein